MVAAAESPERTLKTSGVVQRTEASECGQVKTLDSTFPDIHSRRNEVASFIDTLEIHFGFGKLYGIHSATYINAYNIGANFVFYRHSCSYRTAFAGVYIGHDTYL